jgi:1-acyl-sn-glycerol-3-phosphate acyltransferase
LLSRVIPFEILFDDPLQLQHVGAVDWESTLNHSTGRHSHTCFLRLEAVAVDTAGFVEIIKIPTRDAAPYPGAVFLRHLVATLAAIITKILPFLVGVYPPEHVVDLWKTTFLHTGRITLLRSGESPSSPTLCYLSVPMSYYKLGDERRIDRMDASTVSLMMPALGWVDRYFRYRVHDIERIPTEGPALIAMNHGALPVDVPLLGRRIMKATGRVPRSLADNLIFKTPGLRDFAVATGAVAGHPDTAERLLTEGNLVVVMPGGAAEAFKSSRDAYRLYWRRRLGFARLAIRTQVPVVPAACIGIDELFDIPWDMFEAGKKFFGVRSLPFGIAWGLGPGIPRRVPLVQYIGEPLLPEVPPEAADDDDVVTVFRDRIVDAMEDLMNEGLRRRAEETIEGRRSLQGD